MIQKALFSCCLALILSLSSGVALAGGHSKSKWVDITKDTENFSKSCDYKVWVLEDGNWSETWYLEAFDAENAFYTISRQSSTWSEIDAFYALNYKDKSKFLIQENFIDVRTFALCLQHGDQ